MFPAITSPNNDPGGRGGVLILEDVMVRVNRIGSSFPEAGYRSKRTRDLELNPKPCICKFEATPPYISSLGILARVHLKMSPLRICFRKSL